MVGMLYLPEFIVSVKSVFSEFTCVLCRFRFTRITAGETLRNKLNISMMGGLQQPDATWK